MKSSESISTLAGALAKAQLAIEPATKNATNPHFRSHYANLESVWDACRGALNSNGLSVVQFPCDAEAGRIGLTTMLLHSSGEFLQETFSTPLSKHDAQGIGSALTYLRRYSLASVVGVTATEDDDGNSASTPPTKSQATQSPTAKHIPVSPPSVNAIPKATIAKTQFIDAPKPMDDGMEFFYGKISAYKVETGTAPKSGKPYRRHRISLTCDDGTMMEGATFSETLGEQASECKTEQFPVRIDAMKGKYGYDIRSVVATGLATSTQGAMPNDLPF